MAGPKFTHIHCSSRFDRSAASLETDLDDWMARCSLITVTEVTNDKRASRLREKGWRYYNSKQGNDKDNCAVAWEVDTWHQKYGGLRRLSDHPFDRPHGRSGLYTYASSVVLRHRDSGQTMLVSVSHLPAHVEGKNGFRTDIEQWQARKQAYLSSLKNWAALTLDLERKHNCDATLIIADWNLNLKEHWVRQLIDDRWGKKYHLAWRNFPTSGGSLQGGATGPPGAPGKSTADRIIDGTLFRGLDLTVHPAQMARVASSDHRPYIESFRFLGKGENPADPGSTQGNTTPGEEWWGFGDYMDDEIYQINRVRT